MRRPLAVRVSPLVGLLTVALLAPLAGLAPSVASAQQRRVLFIPGGTVPPRVRRTVEALIASSSTLVSYDTYAQAAAAADVRPSSPQAIRDVATQQGADVIVVAGYGGHYRRRTLRMRYFNGQTGELVTSSTLAMRGQLLRPAAQHAILRDLDAVAGGGTPPPSGGGEGDPGEGGDGGDGGLPPPEDWGDEGAGEDGGDGGGEDGSGDGDSGGEQPEEEPGQWGFEVGVGFGIGQRASEVPTDLGGPARLSTDPYPAIQGRALGYVRPDPAGQLRVALDVRYTTSVGMLVRQAQPGGAGNVTELRDHHLAIGLRTDVPLAPGDRPTMLQLEAGWQFRILDLEDASRYMPDYTLTGLFGRVGLWFHVGDSPISIGIIPEVGYMMNLATFESPALPANDGFLVGAEAHIRLQVVRELALRLLYREAHSFLAGEAPDTQLSNGGRFVIFRAEYIF